MKKKEEKDKWRMWAWALYLCVVIQVLLITGAYVINSHFIDTCVPSSALTLLYITTYLAFIYSFVLFYVKKETRFIAILMFEVILLPFLYLGCS